MFYDEFKINDTFQTSGRTVTEADIVAFAGLSGDFNSLHMDQEYAKTGTFGQRIAHGLLVLSISSGLTVQAGLTTDSIIAFYGIDRLRFVEPVLIGDTVRVKNRVIDLTPKKDDETSGLITFETTVTKQNDKTVLVYHRRLLLRRRAQ
jgi:3-hydroxybutyryl-CoA dehydratase